MILMMSMMISSYYRDDEFICNYLEKQKNMVILEMMMINQKSSLLADALR